MGLYIQIIYIYIFINFAYNHMRSYINILLILIICHHNRQKTVHFVGHRATVTSHTHDSGYVFRHQALAAGASGACAAGYGPSVTLDGVIAGISPGLISHKCGVYHFPDIVEFSPINVVLMIFQTLSGIFPQKIPCL